MPPKAPIFLFPGQGAHEVGMGADLFASDAWFRNLVTMASDALGENLQRLCLRGPEKRLMRSAFLQPLLVAVSLGYWRRLMNTGIEPVAVAGHSLGEITALAATGVLTPELAVAAAIERGKCMDEAAKESPGGMAAVFLPLQDALRAIEQLNLAQSVFAANDNAPEQVVVAATKNNLEAFVAGISQTGAGRCKTLRVSGPWHTPLMKNARRRFQKWLADIPFLPPAQAMPTNVTATPQSNPEQLREAAACQLTDRVRWRETMQFFKTLRHDALIEIGPRRVLSGLARLNGFGAQTTIFNIAALRGIAAMEQSARTLSPRADALANTGLT